jgi:flagella basal body P-ring formation protein FlgA
MEVAVNSQRPLSKRKQVQLMVILTILAWATETLFHQWGYGQVVSSPPDVTPMTVTPDQVSGDQFVPGGNLAGGTLELRGEATITGADVKLKQLCRWSDSDAAIFAPIGDLVVAHITDNAPFRTISLDQIRQTLHDAGVNLGMINFSGPTKCTVTRADASSDPHEALQQWIASQQQAAGGVTSDGGKGDATKIAGTANGATADAGTGTTTQPAALAVAAVAATGNGDSGAVIAGSGTPHSLRELLAADVCLRLGIAPDAIQMNFSPEDEKILALREPIFQFSIAPDRVRNLGAVSWDVTVSSVASSKKITISAVARAWQTRVVVAKPISAKQVLEDEDFTDQRALVESLPDQPLLRRDQCVKQQAAMDLKPGTIMTARLVDPILMVKTGDLVTITVTSGSMRIRAVAIAMETGSMGQTIQVRNETTRDVFAVTVTGPQEARLGDVPAAQGIAAAGN